MSKNRRMLSPRCIAFVVVTVLAGCSASALPAAERLKQIGKPTVEQLGELAVATILENDAATFTRLHVQKNDQTPDGESWIAMGAGKARPDDAWDGVLKDAFVRARADLERTAGGFEGLAFDGLEDVDVHDEGAKGGRFYKMQARLSGRDKPIVLTFQAGMESKRGWVLVDDPIVVVSPR